MKKKQREITIFSLSAIDLFCSAMGVFMILCFIVFPFYQKESPAATPSEPATPTPPAPPEPQPVQEPEVIVQQQVIAGLTLALHWQVVDSGGNAHNQDDIDLHVDAPGPGGQRLHYCYTNKSFPGSPARLVTDSTRGGNEVWLHPSVTPGEYKVSYVFFNEESARSRVKTNLTLIIISGEGETKEVTQSFDGRISPDTSHQYPIATIVVKEDGSVEIIPQ